MKVYILFRTCDFSKTPMIVGVFETKEAAEEQMGGSVYASWEIKEYEVSK